MKIYNLCILIIVDSLLHANSFSLSFTREHVVRTPWKEVKRVLGKFQESSIPPLDHPSSHDLTPRALSHSPLTSFPLVPEVQDPNEKGASGARVKQRGRETAREWTSGRKREREGTRVWCNALRENTISGGFLRSFPPLHPPFSFLPAFPPFHFSSRVTPTFCHRLVKLRKVMEQRILRLTRKVINVTCTTEGKLECFRCYANTHRLLLSFSN